MLRFAIIILALFSTWTHAQQQRTVPQSELIYMQTSNGLIIYELLPQVAPEHVKRFKDLVNEGFYDGLDFYRVIDGFVAQAGEGEPEWGNVKGIESKFKSMLKAEFTRPLSKSFRLAQSPALLAPEEGFINEIPAGRDPKTNEEWLLHCPGMVAMARNNEADSAATEFYINIGQAPRHLDRNMSTFARVVHGLDVAQRMQRGEVSKGGIIENKNIRTKIEWAKIGSAMPKAKQRSVTVDLFESSTFQNRLAAAKKKTHPFYVYPGNGNIDVCYYQPKIYVQ